jgi:hypothetical protein
MRKQTITDKINFFRAVETSQNLATLREYLFKKKKLGQESMIHACNPSYLESRYQEVHYSKPAQANSSLS